MSKSLLTLVLALLLLTGGAVMANSEGLFAEFITAADENSEETGNDNNGDGDVDADVVEADDENGDERSDVAKEVHSALTDEEKEPGDDEFGQDVANNAREGNLGDGVSGAASGDNNNSDERSDVAKEVHSALTESGELEPGDDGFGQAVADKAREGNMGDDVSAAARGANNSDNPNDNENNSDGPGNSGNAGNRGNSNRP